MLLIIRYGGPTWPTDTIWVMAESLKIIPYVERCQRTASVGCTSQNDSKHGIQSGLRTSPMQKQFCHVNSAPSYTQANTITSTNNRSRKVKPSLNSDFLPLFSVSLLPFPFSFLQSTYRHLSHDSALSHDRNFQWALLISCLRWQLGWYWHKMSFLTLWPQT